jgi:hypothetical protein
MSKITIYDESESDLDADFDVIELASGKEVKRKTMEPSDNPEAFRLSASTQAFLIVPRGTPCSEIHGMKRGPQVDAKARASSDS